jgi:hypothetical protein
MNIVDRILKEAMLPPIKNNVSVLDSYSPDDLMEYVTMVRGWFSGAFMGGRNLESFPELKDTFNFLKKLYGEPSNSKLYRVLHLRLGENEDVNSILSKTKISTGPAPIQSWSSVPAGALWYFKHFAVEQNGNGAPEPDKAWVLVEATPSASLRVLADAEQMSQFFSDLYLDFKTHHVGLTDAIKRMAGWYHESDMTKQHEVVCLADRLVDVKIIKVLVAPLSSKIAA